MNFHLEANQFLDQLFKKLEESKVQLEPHWDIDHLCYRVSTINHYESLKNDFQKFSKLLIESDVNGRMISTFKLNEPVLYKNWVIGVVELPAPKPGKKTIEGFEHIEVVCDVPMSELKNRFAHLKTDLGGLKKDINQEFELCFGDINLKFHHLSLESVINLEGNKPVWQALEKSMALKVLKEFDPLIAGTFPLGLQVPGSDLDILIHLKNKAVFLEIVKNNFEKLDNFKVEEAVIDDLETIIVRFKVDSIPFEIFAQKLETIKQKAYVHFLVEEKRLKIKKFPN